LAGSCRIAPTPCLAALLLGLVVSSPSAEPVIREIRTLSNGGVRVVVTAEEGAYYVLRRGPSYRRIVTPVAVASAASNTVELEDRFALAPSATEFYVVQRLDLDRPHDLDGDGLDDAFELSNSTLLNPIAAGEQSADSDGDGLTNFDEGLLGTNPAAPDPAVRVTGRVVLPDGSPIADAEVIAYDHPLEHGLTDAEGRFRLDGVRVGTRPLRLGAGITVGGRRHRALVQVPLTAALDAEIGNVILRILTPASPVTATAGFAHSAVLKQDGTLWGWGSNREGALGQGAVPQVSAPVELVAGTRWKSIATSSTTRTVGVREDGTLWEWGNQQRVPVRVGEESSWTQTVTGDNHGVALRADGTLWTWGRNINGVIGDGTTANRLVPVPIPIGGEAVWTTISAWANHTVALQADGSLWIWGSNSHGQVGNGSRAGLVPAPTRIGGQTVWRAIAAGCFHTLAIRDDGSLWAWGDNQNRQLGDGTTTQRLAPVRIGASTRWRTLAAALFHSAALQDDGSLWVWGTERSGYLGLGAAPARTPTQVAGGHNWAALATGAEHTLAITTASQLWIWGNPIESRLGDPDRMAGTRPLPLNSPTDWRLPPP